MIRYEAVEAAARAMSGIPDGWDRLPEKFRQEYRDAITPILESAAPHLMAAAWDEGIEAGVDGGVSDCDYARNPYRKLPDA